MQFVASLLLSQFREQTRSYGLEDTEVKALQKEVKQCSECTQKLSIDFKSMERNFNKMKKQLDHANLCLRDITNELKDVSKKQDVAQKKANRLQKSMPFLIVHLLKIISMH